jgi:hypothetical protein
MSIVIATALLAAGPVWAGRFGASGAPPAPWRVVPVGKKVKPTAYRLGAVGGVNAVEARSAGSMALLARPIAVDLGQTPILCWRWFVDAPVAKADMTRKSGDDYAARVYVAFDIPDKALDAGTRFKLGIARRMFGAAVAGCGPQLCVGQQASGRNGTAERIYGPGPVDRLRNRDRSGRPLGIRTRDIAADFARAFGKVPGRPVQLAVASDTDNTGSTARAAFADLHFVGRGERCAA